MRISAGVVGILLNSRSTKLAAENFLGLPFVRVRTAVHVQYFTSGECGVGQEQNCIYDFFDLTDPGDRVQPFQKLMCFWFMHGVLITPGAIVFTRMPSFAYSMARARVTAFKAPFSII